MNSDNITAEGPLLPIPYLKIVQKFPRQPKNRIELPSRVVGNVIWDNGQVPKEKPELRQKYAGLTLNLAHDVEVRDNYVKTELNNDYSYAMQASVGSIPQIGELGIAIRHNS